MGGATHSSVPFILPREFKIKREKNRIRDFSSFSEDTFNSELDNVLSNQINHGDSFYVDKAFSHLHDYLKTRSLKNGLESSTQAVF